MKSTFFGCSGGSPPENHWGGMPEYVQADLRSFSSMTLRLADNSKIKVHFRNDEDHAQFEDIVESKTLSRSELEAIVGGKCAHGMCKSIWFPYEKPDCFSDADWVREGAPLNPRYPVYVISTGRWKWLLTARALSKMGVPFTMVLEPSEETAYRKQLLAKGIKCEVLVAPEDFSKRGQGSIPVRNFVWQHSIRAGHKRHWAVDDNIEGFYRLHRNEPHRVQSGAFFRILEDFVDRYKNIALAGFNYQHNLKRREQWDVLYLNTRVYSCILIKNDLDLSLPDHVPPCPEKHFRGTYNEDTDLSIRALKKGLCTVLFNAFNIDKKPTMKMKGGNEQIYAGDGRRLMALSLQAQHPDVARVSKKFRGRWQHDVDYSPFENNQLKLRRGVAVPKGVNNCGLVLVNLKTGKKVTRRKS